MFNMFSTIFHFSIYLTKRKTWKKSFETFACLEHQKNSKLSTYFPSLCSHTEALLTTLTFIKIRASSFCQREQVFQNLCALLHILTRSLVCVRLLEYQILKILILLAQGSVHPACRKWNTCELKLWKQRGKTKGSIFSIRVGKTTASAYLQTTFGT